MQWWSHFDIETWYARGTIYSNTHISLEEINVTQARNHDSNIQIEHTFWCTLYVYTDLYILIIWLHRIISISRLTLIKIIVSYRLECCNYIYQILWVWMVFERYATSTTKSKALYKAVNEMRVFNCSDTKTGLYFIRTLCQCLF